MAAPKKSKLEVKSVACRILAVDFRETHSEYDVGEAFEPVLLTGERLLHEGVVSTSGRVAPHASVRGGFLDSTLKSILLRLPKLEAQENVDDALREAAGWMMERNHLALFLAPKYLIHPKLSKEGNTFLWYKDRGIALDRSWFQSPGVYAVPRDAKGGVVRVASKGELGEETPCAVAFRHKMAIFVPITPVGTAEKGAKSV